MTGHPNQRHSLVETPESQRYLKVLDGGSRTAARLGQRAAVGKDAAGRVFARLRDKRAEAQRAAEDRRSIESGETKNIE